MNESQMLSKMGFKDYGGAIVGTEPDIDALPKVTVLPRPLKELLPWEEFGGTAPTAAFNKHAVTLAKVKLTRDEKKKLRELDEKTDAMRERQKEFYIDRAEKRIQELRDESAKHALSGTGVNLPRVPQYDEIYPQYQAARYAIEQQMRTLYAEAVPILSGIAKRVADACEPLADTLQGDELALHQKTDGLFGWDYVPSRTVIQLRQADWRVPQLVPQGRVSADISKVCEALGFDLWEDDK
jgi:hypothetical protein